MKKIVYKITKIGKKENTTFSGIGYITDTDIIVSGITKNNKQCVRIFEDAVKDCHAIINRVDEFKGCFAEYHTVNERTIEVDYLIWYKLAK